jgi:hypothetical protein
MQNVALTLCGGAVALAIVVLFRTQGAYFLFFLAVLNLGAQVARRHFQAEPPRVVRRASIALVVALAVTCVVETLDPDRHCRPEEVVKIKAVQRALQEYYSENKSPPPLFLTNRAGEPGLSWQVALLPYLGRGDLYRQFRLDVNWLSGVNAEMLDKRPPEYCLAANCGSEMTSIITVGDTPNGGAIPRIKYLVLTRTPVELWTEPHYFDGKSSRSHFRMSKTCCILSGEGRELPLEPTGFIYNRLMELLQ